jgi:hemerythrin superfamily protein
MSAISKPALRVFRLRASAIQHPFSVRFANTATMTTISNAIIKDHRELAQYYNEVVNSSDHDHQQRYGNQFTWELARHSVGEELVVYPAFEKYMGSKGKEMAEHDRKEHHEVLLDFKNIRDTLLIRRVGQINVEGISEHEPQTARVRS